MDLETTRRTALRDAATADAAQHLRDTLITVAAEAVRAMSTVPDGPITADELRARVASLDRHLASALTAATAAAAVGTRLIRDVKVQHS
ncbi:hypothetical protein [Pseudonocardia sp. TRM90224]|uniref:hypothetical protein n=1 Tax=Pseudonocardia sp. TRM90224 TaxID=2812678 RepID=UPI001E2D6246|nr:hypothetical protein [Pseudonocardia sp. TRM90224]